MKHIFHNWSEWQDYRTEELKRTTMTYKLEVENVGLMLVQMRRCEKCKKVQLSNIKTQ